MTLQEKVLEVILSMTGEFTIQDLIEMLATENIYVEGSKDQVVDIIDGYLETNVINHVPYTDKYYV